MAKRRSPGKRPTPLPRRAPLVGAVGTAALAAGLLGCGPKKPQSQPPQIDDSHQVPPQASPEQPPQQEVAPPPQVEESPPPMVPPPQPPMVPEPQMPPGAPQPGPVPPMVPNKQPQRPPKGSMQFPADPPPMVEPFDGIAPPRRKR